MDIYQMYCTVLYRTIMYRTVLYYNKKVRNFQITIILVHRYSFSQRFYEPQRPYTAQKNQKICPHTENRQTDRQRTDREFNYRGHSYPLWIVGVSGPIENQEHLHTLIMYLRQVWDCFQLTFFFIIMYQNILSDV